MVTTIQISGKLQEKLKKRKLYDNESYEDIIWDLLEDNMELSEETKKNIEEYEKNHEKWLKEGKYKTLEQIKKEKGL
ncbi:MAG: hypothetical protein HYU56_03090 [Candidatus Aenigmarchaeota archaeon]|nr:hypothetical protein [Candidatus Aenigmarchaeota archaeon]